MMLFWPLSLASHKWRPRALLAALLGFVLFVLAGAGAAHLTTRPVFESRGLIRQWWTVTSFGNPMIHQPSFFDAQVSLIQSRRVLDAAMNSAAWKAGGDKRSKAAFAHGLEVWRDGFSIRVRYRESDPSIANSAAQAVFDGYVSTHQTILKEIAPLQQQLKGRKTQVIEEVQKITDAILKQATESGGADLAILYDAQKEKLATLELAARNDAPHSSLVQIYAQKGEVAKLHERMERIIELNPQRDQAVKRWMEIEHQDADIEMINAYSTAFTCERADRQGRPVIDNRRRNVEVAAVIAAVLYCPILIITASWLCQRRELQAAASFPVIFEKSLAKQVLAINCETNVTSSPPRDF
jgi:hypothetical protein